MYVFKVLRGGVGPSSVFMGGATCTTIVQLDLPSSERLF